MEKGYTNPLLQQILDEMEKQPWHIKLRRKIKINWWLFICWTRTYWDTSLESCIWNRFKY